MLHCAHCSCIAQDRAYERQELWTLAARKLKRCHRKKSAFPKKGVERTYSLPDEEVKLPESDGETDDSEPGEEAPHFDDWEQHLYAHEAVSLKSSHDPQATSAFGVGFASSCPVGLPGQEKPGSTISSSGSLPLPKEGIDPDHDTAVVKHARKMFAWGPITFAKLKGGGIGTSWDNIQHSVFIGHNRYGCCCSVHGLSEEEQIRSCLC